MNKNNIKNNIEKRFSYVSRFLLIITIALLSSTKAWPIVNPELKDYSLTGLLFMDDNSATLLINPKSNSSLSIKLNNRLEVSKILERNHLFGLVDIQVKILKINDEHSAIGHVLKVKHSMAKKNPVYNTNLVAFPN